MNPSTRLHMLNWPKDWARDTSSANSTLLKEGLRKHQLRFLYCSVEGTMENCKWTLLFERYRELMCSRVVKVSEDPEVTKAVLWPVWPLMRLLWSFMWYYINTYYHFTRLRYLVSWLTLLPICHLQRNTLPITHPLVHSSGLNTYSDSWNFSYQVLPWLTTSVHSMSFGTSFMAMGDLWPSLFQPFLIFP